MLTIYPDPAQTTSGGIKVKKASYGSQRPYKGVKGPRKSERARGGKGTQRGVGVHRAQIFWVRLTAVFGVLTQACASSANTGHCKQS